LNISREGDSITSLGSLKTRNNADMVAIFLMKQRCMWEKVNNMDLLFGQHILHILL